MDHLSDSPQELHTPSSPSPSRAGSSATHLAKKPGPLRIIVPPTEYCPFSTDLTLPITPLSLPTPVSSSCFTFSDMQELGRQSVSVPPTPAPVLLSCSRNTAVTDFASPTSSQFLLMPPTPHLEDGVGSETAICVLPLATPATTNESIRSGSNGIKSENLRPWEVSSSTWLSDLGGHTETDRLFRRNLLEITWVDTDSSPASTPVLSRSAVSPSSQVSSLACNLPSPLAGPPTSASPAPSPCPRIMPPQSPSPARLALKPTGTETFPSTLDSLQAWRESITPGIPRSEEPCSPLTEDVHGLRLEEPVSDTVFYPHAPVDQLYPHHLSPRVPHVSRSQIFMKRAKMLGGRVKKLVTRQSVSKHRGSMDRGINFQVVTSQDSENGSVILITAPPPPYDVGSLTVIPHSPTGQEHVRSRTTSECSSVIQASTGEVTTMSESGSRQRGGNRNTLRRFSLAALSTIKRF